MIKTPAYFETAIQRLAEIRFVRQAIEDRADLSAFKGKPPIKVIVGVCAIMFSYVIGWPLISALGAMAVYFEKSLIVVIGGPVAYGLSHLVFLLGMALAGTEYSIIFFRWVARVTVSKMLQFVSRTTSPSGKVP